MSGRVVEGDKPTVYITTRKRQKHLKKALPKWIDQRENGHIDSIVLVMEQREVPDFEKFELLEEVEILPLTDDDKGLGWIREFVLWDAWERQDPGFILADDDLYPNKGDFSKLVSVALDEEVVGCGATNSYHGLMLGNNEILKTGLAFPIAGGWGHRVVGINTALAVDVGGYPAWNICLGSDTELQRQGVAEGLPWFVHTGVGFGSLGNRHTAGGHNALFGDDEREREAVEQACHARMYKLWPKYVSKPGKPYRCQWKKMYADCIPDWEKRVPKKVKELQNA